MVSGLLRLRFSTTCFGRNSGSIKEEVNALRCMVPDLPRLDGCCWIDAANLFGSAFELLRNGHFHHRTCFGSLVSCDPP